MNSLGFQKQVQVQNQIFQEGIFPHVKLPHLNSMPESLNI